MLYWKIEYKIYVAVIGLARKICIANYIFMDRTFGNELLH